MEEKMKRILINDLRNHVGEEVLIKGWIDIRRDHGKLIFFVVRDVSGLIQAVVVPSELKSPLESIKKIRLEWVVEIRGVLNKRPDNMKKEDKNGDLELLVKDINILAETHELPFEKDNQDLNLDVYLDYLPLTLRSEKSRNIFSVYATAIESFRNILRQNGFTEFQMPTIVGGDAEGGAGVFKVDYFKDNIAYLATSPQLYKQIMVGVFERVFTTAKVFRAEKHATTRHLAEYTTTDFEMGFIEDHTDVMNMLEKIVKGLCEDVLEKHQKVLESFGVDNPLLPEKFPSLKLREAQKIILEETGEDCTNEPDLEPSHERFLCEYAKKKFNSDFIFITHYPVSKRPFYTFEDEQDPGFTKSFDLLFRGLEIATGGQRINSYEGLIKNIEKFGLDPDKFEFYLQAFKYGMPTHGGVGMGIERYMEKLLGLDNIRKAVLFPRDMNRIDTLLNK